MSSDDTKPDTDKLDAEGLKGALGRTGRMLKTAGLPFEEDEFDEETEASGLKAVPDADADADADADSSSSSDEDGDSSSSSEDAPTTA